MIDFHSVIRWTISLAIYAAILFLIYYFVRGITRRLKNKGRVAKPKQKNGSPRAAKTKDKAELSKFIRRVKRKSGIPREYIILLISSVIAILIVLFGAIFTVTDTVDSNGNGMRELPLNESDTPTASESGDTIPPLDIIIVIATLIALAPYGFYVYLQRKRRIKYEQEFARFLFELSELLRGGLDPVTGVLELQSSTTLEVYGRIESLAPHIDLLAKQLEWGMTFEEGMFELAKQLKSELIEKYTYLVVQASRIGGGIGDVILQCSKDMENTFVLEREKDSLLREYITVIYVAQFILVGLLVLLYQTVLPSLQSMTAAAGAGAITGFAISPVNIDFQTSFFRVMMINGFASGIIGGIMSEGDVRQGIKHSVILVTVSLIVCLIFLT